MPYYYAGREFNSVEGMQAYANQKRMIKEKLGMSYEDFAEKTDKQLKLLMVFKGKCKELSDIIDEAIKRNGNGLPF